MGGLSVSAVVAVRNGVPYLADALDSVLAEPEVSELVVVDDGSTDGTPGVLAGYGSRIRCLHQPPLGQAAALNRALAAAHGELVTFQDADDLWVPGRLAQLVAALVDAEADGAYGWMMQFVSPDLDPSLAARTRVDLRPRPARLLTALVVRRDAFSRVGTLDEQLATGANIDWMSRAGVAGLRLVEAPSVVTRRRIHATNLGRAVGANARNADLLAIVRAHVGRRRSVGEAS